MTEKPHRVSSLLPHEQTEALESPQRAATDELNVSDAQRDEGPLENDRYQFGQLLGRGGMGEVLKAKDGRLLREVAVKRIISEEDAEAVARFTTEARIGGQLDHPGVLPVYDFGHAKDGTPFFTMKLVPGHRTVRDLIADLRAADPAKVAALSFQRRVALMQQVCRAMTYAHRRGVIHRDLKPSNLVVGNDGEVYVVDWGIASLLDNREGDIEVDDRTREVLSMCDKTSLIGTPAYMAPETIDKGVCDERTDTWSLCVILFELLTLEHPLGGRTLFEVREAFKNLPPTPAEKFLDPLQGRIPRSLSLILSRGMSPERSQRFTGPEELEQVLQIWLEGLSPAVCAGTFMQRALRRVSYYIDQYPFAVPMVLLVAFSIGLAVIVDGILDIFLALVDRLTDG